MKKGIIVLILGLTLATPTHAQIASTTGVFTEEQKTIINQIIALIYELQRQLQVQLAVEAQEKSNTVDLKAECNRLSEEREALWPQMEAEDDAYTKAVNQWNLSGNPYDYSYLPNLTKEHDLRASLLDAQELVLINQRRELCN